MSLLRRRLGSGFLRDLANGRGAIQGVFGWQEAYFFFWVSEALELNSESFDPQQHGITLSDPDQPDNPIMYANEAFELTTGYGRNEIVGRNCRFLQGKDRDQSEIDRFREALREHKPVTVTLRNYRKNGELFYNQFSIRPLFDRNGKLIYYLGTQYDVSEKVRADEELRRLNALLAAADG